MSSQENIEKASRPNCCQNSCVVYVLTPLVIVLLVVGALTAGYFAFDQNTSFVSSTISNETLVAENINVCSNANCVVAASQILSFIDESVDPCTDYHQFVCGTFLKTAYENEITNPFNHNLFKLLKKRDHLILDPISPKDSQLVHLQKQFYQSCMSRTQIDDDKNVTIVNLINKVDKFSKDTQKNQDFDWIDAMIGARKSGFPFDWFLRVDLHETDYYNLLITHPKNCSSFQSNFTEMQFLQSFLQETEDTADIQNIVSFQKKLLLTCEKSKNEEVIEGNIADLESLWFREGFLHFITSMTGQNKKWRLDSKIFYHNYMVRLSHLLKSTPKKTQHDFVLWKILEYFAPFWANPTQSAFLDSKNKKSLSEFCLEDTKQRFQDVSTSAQIQQFLQNDLSNKLKFVDTIIAEAKSQIEQILWYKKTQEEKNLAFYEALRRVIGGLATMANSTFFDSYLNLDQVHFQSDNVIVMITELNKSIFNSKMKKIGEPVFQKHLVDYILKANNLNQIMISPEETYIVVPSLLFDSMIYQENVPNYLNFGGLGTLVALELAQQLLKLNNPLKDSYKQAVDNHYCFLEKLENSNISLPQLEVFETNYPFLIAQDIVYNAYQKQDQEEEQLAGLKYTPKQLFWIRSTLNWCLAPEDRNNMDYELYKLRILESVKNSERFVEDFNCNYGSAMNPVKKCGVL